MKRKTPRFLPGQFSLESRELLSTVGFRPAAEVAALTSLPVRGSIVGSLSGRYISDGEDGRAADAPLRVNLNATGSVTGLGRVRMTGYLDFGGFRVAGSPDISGVVTLSNSRGSVTIQVTGFGGFSEIPGNSFSLNAAIVRGTGVYANVRAIGTASAAFGPNSVRCITAPCPIGGNLNLGVNLLRPVR